MPPNTPDSGRQPIGFGVFTHLLNFLDRNLKRFSPLVQDAIGLVVVCLVALVVAHLIAGKSFIHGRVVLYDGEGNQFGRGEKYIIEIPSQSQQTIVNAEGAWMLPASPRVVPVLTRVHLRDDKGRAVGQFDIRGPFVFWSTLLRAMHEIAVEADVEGLKRPKLKRVESLWVREDAGSRPMISTLWSRWPSQAYAQTPAENTGHRHGATTTMVVRVRERVAAGDSTTPVVPGLAILEVKTPRFPSFLRSSGTAFVRVMHGQQVVADRSLLFDRFRDVPIAWFTPVTDREDTVTIYPSVPRFSVQSIKESWLRVRAGVTERYSGLIANLEKLVTLQKSDEGSRAFTVTIPVDLRLQLIADNEAILGTFDVSSALREPGVANRLRDQAPGENAEVVVAFMLGQPIGVVTPSQISTALTIVSNTRVTGNHHCSRNCRGEPTRTTYSVELLAGPGAVLEDPRLECIAGPCPWSAIQSVLLTEGNRRAVAVFEVWSAPTTWRLSAKEVRRVR